MKMVKVRQDAWSHEDDLLLAETVLRHVREGSTQLNAFDEVGDHLNRTSAACGFRWNAEVRKKYNNAMDLAKRQRKEKKRAIANKPVIKLPQPQHYTVEQPILSQKDSPLSMDEVIHFLQNINKNYQESNQSKFVLEQAQSENQHYRERINELEQELAKTKQQLATVQEDYQVFIQIMDRARKMTVLDDQGSLKAPAFRMDKNGNLEQLAQGQNQ
jgi:prespore-specific regulator